MTEIKKERVTLLKLKEGFTDKDVDKMKKFLVKHDLFVKFVPKEKAFEIKDKMRAKKILNDAKQGLSN